MASRKTALAPSPTAPSEIPSSDAAQTSSSRPTPSPRGFTCAPPAPAAPLLHSSVRPRSRAAEPVPQYGSLHSCTNSCTAMGEAAAWASVGWWPAPPAEMHNLVWEAGWLTQRATRGGAGRAKQCEMRDKHDLTPLLQTQFVSKCQFWGFLHITKSCTFNPN